MIDVVTVCQGLTVVAIAFVLRVVWIILRGKR